MKRGILFLIIFILIASPLVNAYSFWDFREDRDELKDRLIRLITGSGTSSTGSGTSSSLPAEPPDDGCPPEGCAVPEEDSNLFPGGGGGGPDDDVCDPDDPHFCVPVPYFDLDKYGVAAWVPWLNLSQCGDGTLYGECSKNVPKYCEDGDLIDDCSICGCPPGTGECLEDGSCGDAVNCDYAGGICDTTCSSGFIHYSRLDDTCSSEVISQDARPLIEIAGEAVAEGIKCCIPFRYGTFTNVTYKQYVEKEWLNVSMNRTLTYFGAIDECVDLSDYNKCSSDKPLYCYRGDLYNFCSKCGCPEGQFCNPLTNVCVGVAEKEQVDVFVKFSQLSSTEKTVMESFLTDLYSAEQISGKVVADYDGSKITVDVNKNLMLVRFDELGRPSIDFDFSSSVPKIIPDSGGSVDEEQELEERESPGRDIFNSPKVQIITWGTVILGIVLIVGGQILSRKYKR